MKITLTVSTWSFKHVGGEYDSPRRVVERIQSLGFQPELWLHWDAAPDCYDRREWQPLGELIGAAPALSFHTRNDRQRMFEEIEMLAALGGRVLVVHPCVLSDPDFRDERPAAHPDVPFVRDLADAARAHGVYLGLENIFDRLFLDRTLEQVDAFDGSGGLGICIDLGHAEMKRPLPRQSPVDLIRDYAPALLHLHVHDVVAGRDHRAPGTGSIDYPAVVDALREIDFNGTAALEFQAPEPVAAVGASWDYLHGLLGDELTR